MTGPMTEAGRGGGGVGRTSLQLTPASAPARGLASWLAGAHPGRHHRRAPGRRDGVARDPGAGGRPRGLPRRGRRGLSAAGRRGPGQRPAGDRDQGLGADTTGRPARRGPGTDREAGTGCRMPWRARAPELDLSPGVPDLSGFPRAAWLRAERAGAGPGQRRPTLGYGDPRGSAVAAPRAGGLARPHPRACGRRPDDIIVVSGVAQSLALLAQWLQRPRADPDRRRGPRLARSARRARLLGPGAGPGPGRRATACGSATWRETGVRRRAAHARASVPHRGRARAAAPPRAAGLGGRSGTADHRGRLRRRVPLRPGAGARAAGLRARITSPTPAARPRRWPRGCGSAGWCRRPGCTRTWWRPSTPATWAAPRCRSWCWPS